MITVEQRKILGWRQGFVTLGPRLALLLHLSLIMLYLVVGLTLARQGGIWRGDFPAFYTSGAIVLGGDGRYLYDLATQERHQQAALGDLRRLSGDLNIFVNPPHTALLMMPFALLPASPALLAWTALQILLLLWSVRRALEVAARWSTGERHLLIATTLAFLPVYITFVTGTYSLLLLLCLWEVYYALRRGQDVRAGMWLAFGLIKPQVWVLLIVMLLVKHRWRALASAAAVSSGLVALTSLLLGPRIYLDWLMAIQILPGHPDSAIYSVISGPHSMYNLRGTLTLWLGANARDLVSMLSWAALGVAAAGTAWLWRGRWQPETPAFTARLALTIVLGLLVSPHLHWYDSLLLVVPATLAYGIERQWAASRSAFGALVLCSPSLYIVSHAVVGTRLGIHVPVLLMVGLLLWLAYRTRSEVARERLADATALS